MATGIFIDTYTRDLRVNVVSITEVPGKGLVLRFAAEIGCLADLADGRLNSRGEGFENRQWPVIVPRRGYEAISSAGFVEVNQDLYKVYRDKTYSETLMVGVQGFPWQHRKGLNILSDPMKVLIMPPEMTIKRLITHYRSSSDGSGYHSNVATAKAAREGLAIVSQLRPQSVIISEGQSDHVEGFELAPMEVPGLHDKSEKLDFEFPEEHQKERFCEGAFFKAALARRAFAEVRRMEVENNRADQISAIQFQYCHLILAHEAWSRKLLTAFVREMMSGDQLREIARATIVEWQKNGWGITIDTKSIGNMFVVLNPEGNEVLRGCQTRQGPVQFERHFVMEAELEAGMKQCLMDALKQVSEDRNWIEDLSA